MLLVAKERDTFLERLYELRPIARGLSPGEMRWPFGAARSRYPMGRQTGRLTRHETLLAKPLARPKISPKISEPSRFARPFQSRPRGVSDRLGKCPRPRRLV